MTPDFAIGQGDLLPIFPFQCAYPDNQEPVDLTGATCTFTMVLEGSSSNKINAIACTITDPVNGKGYYTWIGTDTDTPGDYLAFVRITFASGNKMRVPNLGFSRVQVTALNEATSL